ncbi:MAG: hypothetical protein IPP47_20375 [Bryobacterales bacterium]|nr:hypothetical protein [Bryobacterales bacterium]
MELHVVRRVDPYSTVVEEQKVRLIDDGVPAERIRGSSTAWIWAMFRHQA